MSRNAEEQEDEQVELEFPNLQDTEQVARFAFGRTTGRPTIDEVEFREWYQKQILFPELLRRGGISLPDGGNGPPSLGPSDQKPKKKGKGLLEKLLGSVGGTVQESLGEALGLGLGGTIAAAGGVAGTILAWWYAEEQIDELPPILHTFFNISEAGLILINTLVAWIMKLGGLLPSADEVKNIFKNGLENIGEKWWLLSPVATIVGGFVDRLKEIDLTKDRLIDAITKDPSEDLQNFLVANVTKFVVDQMNKRFNIGMTEEDVDNVAARSFVRSRRADDLHRMVNNVTNAAANVAVKSPALAPTVLLMSVIKEKIMPLQRLGVFGW